MVWNLEPSLKAQGLITRGFAMKVLVEAHGDRLPRPLL